MSMPRVDRSFALDSSIPQMDPPTRLMDVKQTATPRQWTTRGRTWLSRLVLFIVCLVMWLCIDSLPASALNNDYWQGNPNNSFNSAVYWSSGAVPGSNDIAVFNGSAVAGTVNVSSAVTVGGISFTTGGWKLQGSQLTVGSGGVACSHTSGVNTISAVLAGSGAVSMSGAGGTLVLSGANSYTGTTTLSAGTLQLSGTGTLGATTAPLAVTGGTLDLNGTSQSVGAVSGSAGTVLNNGAGTSTLTATGGSYGGTIKDNSAGTGKVAVVAAGGVTLSGVNAYTGGTTINGSGNYLQLTTSNTAAGTGTVTVNTGAALLFGNALTVANAIGGAGDVYNFNSPASTVTLTGALSYTGRTLFRTAGSSFNFQSAGNNTLSGAIGVPGVTVVAASVAGGNVIQSGTGTLTLSGPNVYTGATTVSGGVLKLGVANAVGSASAITLNGGTLNSGGFSDAMGALTLSSSSTVDFTSTGSSVLTFSDSHTATWTGTLTINNWRGSPAGGGTTQILVGSGNSGLTAAQQGEISFLNPSGFAAGTYAGSQRSTGEVVPATGPVTSLLVTAPSTATAQIPFNFTVTAVDMNGNTVTSYAGTVKFSTMDKDPQVSTPANSTLTNGTGTFSAALETNGSAITATDTVTGSITGTSNTITIADPVLLSSFSPTSGPAGTAVTITGADFLGVTGVQFGGVSTTQYLVDSDYQITAVVPAGASTGVITIVTAHGTGNTASVGPPNFTVNSGPKQVALSPNNAAVNGGSFNLIVAGSNFASDSVVKWNGSTRPTTFNSATQVTAAISNSDLGTAGSATVTVTNPTTGAGDSNGLIFHIGSASVVVGLAQAITRNGTVTVVLKISNTGSVDAANLQVTAASMGGASSASTPTAGITVTVGSSQNITLSFPSATTTGAGVLKLNGTFSIGTKAVGFGSNRRVTVP